jgi:murein DD-endopeptidase MepM/ murein hydrolase activator NlpD
MPRPWSPSPRLAIALRALVIPALVTFTTPATRAQETPPEVVEAVVFYGEDKLLEADDPLSDEALAQLLDSLCTLDPAPLELIRDLRMLQRIRGMDEHAMVLLIDSLFELETVPYALINEINLYASEMPTQLAVDEGERVAWTCTALGPCGDLYGEWVTDNPNAYGPELSANDHVLLLDLFDRRSGCGFHMPVPGVLTSRYGPREGRHHNGIDLDLRTGEPVRSMFPGVVRFAGSYGSFGRLVVVRHWNGLETFYAHLHRLKVAVGDEVEAGDVVGLGGNSGRSTAPHLHLEVRFKGIPIDPSRFIDLSLGEPSCDVLVLKKTRWRYAAYPLGTRFHTVRKGEHLYAIAEQYGTSVNDLCELNGISRRSTLRVGQQLIVQSPGG